MGAFLGISSSLGHPVLGTRLDKSSGNLGCFHLEGGIRRLPGGGGLCAGLWRQTAFCR